MVPIVTNDKLTFIFLTDSNTSELQFCMSRTLLDDTPIRHEGRSYFLCRQATQATVR